MRNVLIAGATIAALALNGGVLAADATKDKEKKPDAKTAPPASVPAVQKNAPAADGSVKTLKQQPAETAAQKVKPAPTSSVPAVQKNTPAPTTSVPAVQKNAPAADGSVKTLKQQPAAADGSVKTAPAK